MTRPALTEKGSERLLVLLLDDAFSASEVQRALRRGAGPTAIHVVAPAHVDLLHWYATDESGAWAEAAGRARRATALAPAAADVRAGAGEADPVLAVEDALQEFPADEVVIVGGDGANGELETSLRRLGLPVTRLGAAPDASRAAGSRAREAGRAIMSGRSDATPYAIFVGVVLAMGAVVLAILAIGLLLMWLG
jgi:hypothetical protein